MKTIHKSRVLISILIMGLVLGTTVSMPSFATVPGVNAAMDVNTSSNSPNGPSAHPSVSQDGRFVAFRSNATDLVSPSTTGQQLFVRDRLNGTTELISKSTSGTEGNSNSQFSKISEDGRYVVFESYATNLVTGDTNNKIDIFVRDRHLGTTTLASKNASGTIGNNHSYYSDISADGKYVVFYSTATNLVSSPIVTQAHTYLKNMQTGAVTLISKNSSGQEANTGGGIPRISCEGRFVTFDSMSNNLTSGDTYNPTKSKTRVYIVDMLNATIDPQYIRGSADGSSSSASISCNGNYITFTSSSTNLVTGDTNAKDDVFKYDRINDTITLVSVDSSGNQANQHSNTQTYGSSISNDGKYITFTSGATNLVTGDTNAVDDVFLRNTQASTTELVSRDSGGTFGNSFSWNSAISSDGKYITYWSGATNLISGYTGDIYSSKSGADYDY